MHFRNNKVFKMNDVAGTSCNYRCPFLPHRAVRYSVNIWPHTALLYRIIKYHYLYHNKIIRINTREDTDTRTQ